MPASISIPPHLIQFVGSPTTSLETASEALEEWIIHRRGKGDTLFEVSVGLAELEDRTPPHCRAAFGRARYVTNVPPPSDLTPPIGPFPLSRSASPLTILHHLLSQPPPTIEHSREVILEFVLNRETKLRDKKAGRGGKGTLGREGFEDIASRLAEIEDGLRIPGVDALELSANRQLGLALILSLRMSLSYFTLKELADQLLKLAAPDAERVVVQHIRKRVAGEGRYGIGKELEQLEGMIPLPAPSKSGCIKLISGFIKDNGEAGPSTSAISPSSATASPATPYTPLSNGTPVQRSSPLPDPNPIANYVFELISEYITREKREYMSKSKWAIKGRDALNKDLGEIESTFCVAKNGPSASAAELIPTFLVLRRQFNLPKSNLPPAIIEPYLDILPAPPDPDDEPYREPSVATTTARLYVNPRLDDLAAYQVLEELIDSEREKVDEGEEWLTGLIEQIEKRFPDGSYEAVFAQIKIQIANPVTTSEPTLQQPKIQKQPSVHRRTVSTAATTLLDTSDSSLTLPPSLERKISHSRSTSLPSRKATFDDNDAIELASNSSEDVAPTPRPIVSTEKPVLPALHTDTQPLSHFLSPREISADRSSAGWWDVVSAIEGEGRPLQPWRSRNSVDLPLPPGAEPARAPELSSPLDEDFNKLDFWSSPPISPPRNPPTMVQASPSRRARAQTSITGSPASVRSDGSPMSAPPVSRPPPVPINFARPSFPSPGGNSPSADRSPPPAKSKLGTFGRSLSIAGKGMIARAKEREKEKEEKEKEEKELEKDKENEKVNVNGSSLMRGRTEKVQNSPGKWNKDMVANIMGPPVDRK